MRSLTDPKERELFEEYKITEIKNHISSREDQILIEHLVNSLPVSSVLARVALLQILQLEKAEALMAGKPESERMEILETLRHKEVKGPWALKQIEIEAQEAKTVLFNDVSNLLRAKLEEKCLAMQADIGLGRDVNQIRARQMELGIWKNQMLQQIESLVPMESRITLMHTAAQNEIRERILVQMRVIFDAINRGPANLMEE